MKKRHAVMIIISTIVVLIGIILLSLLWMIRGSIIYTKTPPKPETTYGEFPFRLEYEINGEKHIIEDVWVCEFDGFSSNIGFGKQRKWNGKLKSNGKDKIVLLEVKDPVDLGRWGVPEKQTVYYLPGPARYYMGDMIGVAGIYRHSFPDAFCYSQFDDFTSEATLEADTLYSAFGIRLIDWQYTQPITNSFFD